MRLSDKKPDRLHFGGTTNSQAKKAMTFISNTSFRDSFNGSKDNNDPINNIVISNFETSVWYFWKGATVMKILVNEGEISDGVKSTPTLLHATISSFCFIVTLLVEGDSLSPGLVRRLNY